MVRFRTLLGLVLALVATLAVMWFLPGTPSLPDDGTERTTADLLVGTWERVSVDGRPYASWYSSRVEYRADGTYRTSNNGRFRVIRLTQREGRYEVIGRVVRHHYELNAQDVQIARDTGQVPVTPTWGDCEVATVNRDELVERFPVGSDSRALYRRVH